MRWDLGFGVGLEGWDGNDLDGKVWGCGVWGQGEDVMWKCDGVCV